MRITVLPCIGTNWCVGDISDGELPVEIHSPRKMTSGEQELLVAKLYRDVAHYKWELDLFKHLAYLIPIWGLASGVAVYVSLKALFDIHLAFGMLYTWNILWLMADGLWLTIQVVTKGLNGGEQGRRLELLGNAGLLSLSGMRD